MHLQTGSFGEDIAVHYLSNRGFPILSRNVRMKFGEIDIVAKSSNGTLIFIEVKTLTRASMLSPEDNLTRAKFKKLSRACSAYANAHPELINNTLGWRIDLIAITLDPPSNLINYKYGKNNFAVFHYENIF